MHTNLDIKKKIEVGDRLKKLVVQKIIPSNKAGVHSRIQFKEIELNEE